MIVPQLQGFTALSLLILRVVVALVFVSSGWSHLTKSEERAEGMGLSPTFTFVLGAVELGAAISISVGIFAQIGALVLIAVMLGAIHRKVFVWEVGFWGEESQGWYYDLLYLGCNLVILTTAGGSLVLLS